MRLFRRVEDILDSLLRLGVSPRAKEIAHRVELEHLLQRQCILASDDTRERQIEDWVPFRWRGCFQPVVRDLLCLHPCAFYGSNTHRATRSIRRHCIKLLTHYILCA